LGWLPGGGVKQGFLSWVMPVLTQGLLAAAILLHHSRSAMLAQTEAAYVRTARGKGCSEKRMVFRHALRNALVPIISSVAASLGTMLGSSIIVENIFQIPGLGFWLLEAILIQDFLLSLSIVLALAILCMLVQFIADILCAILDPRLRQQPLRRWQVKPKMH